MSASDRLDPERVSHLRVGSDRAGQRIDNFLLSLLKGVPRAHVYRIVRRGEVRVNRGRVMASYRLREGDSVRVPPVRRAQERRGEPPAALLARLSGRIVYRDHHLVVLDKPAGMPVHGGTGVRWGVVELMRVLLPQDEALDLAHRLDRHTSGCLVLARQRQVLGEIHEAFRRGAVDKGYLLLTRGRWDAAQTCIRRGLATGGRVGGERHVRVDDDGKTAVTRFRPLALYRLGTQEVTLVEARPETGRMHQIRVHALEAGHPIAGDHRYGEAVFNARMREAGLHRLFLHAHELALPGRPQWHFSTPLAAELAKVLERLEAAT